MLELKQRAANAEADDFQQKVEQAAGALHDERRKKRITGGKVDRGLTEIDELERVAVIGDLHGDSKSLFQILSEINYEHFVSNPMNKLIFLGDYVDRGSDSVGVMYSVCYLKSTYPESVILMRGNHEAPAEFPFSSHMFPDQLRKRFSAQGVKIYQSLLSMFKSLQLVTMVRKKLFLVHGGLPTNDEAISNFRSSIATAQENYLQTRVLEELLWSDPRQIDTGQGWEMSRRGLGSHFGSVISRRWLNESGTKVVLRGHEPCRGFRLDHDDKIMTIFSCREAYPEFRAAYLTLEKDQLDIVNDAKDLSRYVRFLELP